MVLLDRPRHQQLVEEIRATGARIKFIVDGDVAGAISAARPGSGVDLLLGIGGTPDSILPMRDQMPGLYGQVTEVCRQAGFTPRAVQKDVWLMQTIVGLVASGIGVALIPASLRNFRRKGVVYKTVRNLSPKVEMGMVWRRGDASPVLSAFLDVVGEVAPLAQGKRAKRRTRRPPYNSNLIHEEETLEFEQGISSP